MTRKTTVKAKRTKKAVRKEGGVRSFMTKIRRTFTTYIKKIKHKK